jgi:hypothetical protein
MASQECRMYIKNDDFGYLEHLCNSLDDDGKKRFMRVLLKAGSIRSEEDTIQKIQVVSDEIYDVRGIDPKEFITRTMIKKAYKAAKEAKQ